MTSQVAIFNLNGIAVASDTVSTSNSDKGSKTTNNAEKIYPLGREHLVVALHFGGTAINDLHHQFHFNRWVESLNKPLPTLDDYLQSYVDWTEKNQLHSADSENDQIKSIIFNHFKELIRRTQKDIENENPTNFEEFLHERLHFHTKEGLEYLKNLPRMQGVALEYTKSLINHRKIDIKEIFASAKQDFWAFENISTLPTSINRLLGSSAPLAVVGEQDLPWDSYLAFVGYGAKDNFGSSLEVRFRSIIDGKLIYSKKEIKSISPGSGQSRIQPFAQTDALESFIQGYNEDIMDGVVWAIKEQGKKVLDSIDLEVLERIAEGTREYIFNYSRRAYVYPMLSQISGMNLFSLSELARTLVGLQATSSESKDGPVSVGGLIEVLTIDRINGVQWRYRLP